VDHAVGAGVGGDHFDAPFVVNAIFGADGDHGTADSGGRSSSIVTTSAAMTLPATTWHVRIAVSLGMSANKASTVPAGSSGKYLSVARTPNGLRLERWDQASRSNSSSQSLERSYLPRRRCQ
jgi:hypothetical protein